MRGADLGTVGTEEAAGAPERRPMIAMTFTIELDIGALLPSARCAATASDRSRDETHRRGRPKHSYGYYAICCVWTGHGIRDIT